jgi:hypothetical protein
MLRPFGVTGALSVDFPTSATSRVPPSTTPVGNPILALGRFILDADFLKKSRRKRRSLQGAASLTADVVCLCVSGPGRNWWRLNFSGAWAWLLRKPIASTTAFRTVSAPDRRGIRAAGFGVPTPRPASRFIGRIASAQLHQGLDGKEDQAPSGACSETKRLRLESGGIGGGCTTLFGCSTAIECDGTR